MAGTGRLSAMMAGDRLMFCLGVAAILIIVLIFTVCVRQHGVTSGCNSPKFDRMRP